MNSACRLTAGRDFDAFPLGQANMMLLNPSIRRFGSVEFFELGTIRRPGPRNLFILFESGPLLHA
jgi:hypothetical protein